MKISVITVCYNSAKTLEGTRRSIVDPDHKDVEHIVIDGGSSDGSADILASYRTGLSHLVSEPVHGIYDAMNKGLALARGEVICFLNADDHYASPKVLSQVVRKMQPQICVAQLRSLVELAATPFAALYCSGLPARTR